MADDLLQTVADARRALRVILADPNFTEKILSKDGHKILYACQMVDDLSDELIRAVRAEEREKRKVTALTDEDFSATVTEAAELLRQEGWLFDINMKTDGPSIRRVQELIADAMRPLFQQMQAQVPEYQELDVCDGVRLAFTTSRTIDPQTGDGIRRLLRQFHDLLTHGMPPAGPAEVSLDDFARQEKAYQEVRRALAESNRKREELRAELDRIADALWKAHWCCACDRDEKMVERIMHPETSEGLPCKGRASCRK